MKISHWKVPKKSVKKTLKIFEEEKSCEMENKEHFSIMTSKLEMGSIPVHTEEVAIFLKPPMNEGEEKISWVQYRPSFITQGGYSFAQFHISGNSTHYLDSNRTELYLK